MDYDYEWPYAHEVDENLYSASSPTFLLPSWSRSGCDEHISTCIKPTPELPSQRSFPKVSYTMFSKSQRNTPPSSPSENGSRTWSYRSRHERSSVRGMKALMPFKLKLLPPTPISPVAPSIVDSWLDDSSFIASSNLSRQNSLSQVPWLQHPQDQLYESGESTRYREFPVYSSPGSPTVSSLYSVQTDSSSESPIMGNDLSVERGARSIESTFSTRARQTRGGSTETTATGSTLFNSPSDGEAIAAGFERPPLQRSAPSHISIKRAEEYADEKRWMSPDSQDYFSPKPAQSIEDYFSPKQEKTSNDYFSPQALNTPNSFFITTEDSWYDEHDYDSRPASPTTPGIIREAYAAPISSARVTVVKITPTSSPQLGSLTSPALEVPGDMPLRQPSNGSRTSNKGTFIDPFNPTRDKMAHFEDVSTRTAQTVNWYTKQPELHYIPNDIYTPPISPVKVRLSTDSQKLKRGGSVRTMVKKRDKPVLVAPMSRMEAIRTGRIYEGIEAAVDAFPAQILFMHTPCIEDIMKDREVRSLKRPIRPKRQSYGARRASPAGALLEHARRQAVKPKTLDDFTLTSPTEKAEDLPPVPKFGDMSTFKLDPAALKKKQRPKKMYPAVSASSSRNATPTSLPASLQAGSPTPVISASSSRSATPVRHPTCLRPGSPPLPRVKIGTERRGRSTTPVRHPSSLRLNTGCENQGPCCPTADIIDEYSDIEDREDEPFPAILNQIFPESDDWWRGTLYAHIIAYNFVVDMNAHSQALGQASFNSGKSVAPVLPAKPNMTSAFDSDSDDEESDIDLGLSSLSSVDKHKHVKVASKFARMMGISEETRIKDIGDHVHDGENSHERLLKGLEKCTVRIMKCMVGNEYDAPDVDVMGYVSGVERAGVRALSWAVKQAEELAERD